MADVFSSITQSRIHAGTLAEKFESGAEILDKHSKNVNIARVVGGGTGLFFGAAALVGLVASPVTGGLSAAIAISTIGGLVSAGAKLVETILETSKFKELSSDWDKFCKTIENEQREMERREKKDRVVAALTQGGVEVALKAGFKQEAKGAAKACSNGTKLGKSLSKGFVVLNLISLGLNMYDIVDGCLELQKTHQSKAGDILRKLAKSLKHYSETGQWSR